MAQGPTAMLGCNNWWIWWQPTHSLLSFLLQLVELLLGLAELLLGFGQFLLHVLAWSSLTSCFGGLFLNQLEENTDRAAPRD